MNRAFSKARAGVAFKEDSGKLYRFKPHSVEVLLAWPSPKAWRKTLKQPHWSQFRPDIKLPYGDIDANIERYEAYAEESGQLLFPFYCTKFYPYLMELYWYRTIPADVRALMGLFEARQWHILSFLARCGPGAAELTEMNPALAFALASNWVFHKPVVQRPLRAARSLVNKRQRDILTWLGFPGTEAARRVMAKVDPQSITITRLLYLRQAMMNPAMLKAMSHLPCLNGGVLRMVTDPELFPYTTPTLLEETARNANETHLCDNAYMLSDCKRMFELLPPRGARFPIIRNTGALQGIHETLVNELANAEIDTTASFPLPPISGTDTIVPITTAQELLEEGRIQHHCVASYINHVAYAEKIYVYRVLKPERATLALGRKGDAWRIYELKLACNHKPSDVTYQSIINWLGDRNRDLAS